ncbi:hypothetical protein [Novosphingobium sediminicola]|uniref:Uncharacterized protein n=1 Tax=Novosphingobium sediminicola TaxID=563162 RepID=A0A7W6G554_9SPHN|nr:hypothetical protein [Novosphingobium sediminicola]MBB3953908.1 hypothetical protein [Novosphingobium sediminicola]
MIPINRRAHEADPEPAYFGNPMKYSRTCVHARDRSEVLAEYACNENNIDVAHLGPGPEAYAIGPRPVGTRKS